MLQITLHPLHLDDAPYYHQLTGNPAVMQYISGQALSYEDSQQEVARLVNNFSAQQYGGIWKCLDQKEFIGVGALIPIAKHAADIGFRVVQSYWKKGYGTAIAEELINMAKKLELSELIAIVDNANFGSKRIIENLEFEYVGTTPNHAGGMDLEYKKILS
ncbi:MAG: GNAT family N-acetyltransferase [Aureispira sp.]|nr:GNAT family N-acetyltransferase [Aureispira sp.]